MADFVAESIAQEDQHQPEVFICYADDDLDIANRINEQLQTHGFITWHDQAFLPATISRESAIEQGIMASGNLLLLASLAINKPQYIHEITTARNNNKRIVVALYENISVKDLIDTPGVPVVDFRIKEKDFATSFSSLLRTLDQDRDYIKGYNAWQNEALAWQQQDETEELLLRGSRLILAEEWIDNALKTHKNPPPSPLLQKFVSQSRDAVLALERKKKRTARLMKVFLILTSLLFLASVNFALIALREKGKALEQEKNALEQKEEAQRQKDSVEAQKKRVDEERKKAIALKNQAEEARRDAEEKQKQIAAYAQKVLSLKTLSDTAKAQAIRAQQKAEQEALNAKNEKNRANIAAINAEKERLNAEKLLNVTESWSLASKSIQLIEKRQEQPALNLALHAYYLNKEANYKTHNPVIYQALYKCHESIFGKRVIKNKDKIGLNALCTGPSGFFVTSANNGDVVLWNTNNNTNLQRAGFTEAIRDLILIPGQKWVWVLFSSGKLIKYDFAKSENRNMLPLNIKSLPNPGPLAFCRANADTMYIAAHSANIAVVWRIAGNDSRPVFQKKRRCGQCHCP